MILFLKIFSEKLRESGIGQILRRNRRDTDRTGIECRRVQALELTKGPWATLLTYHYIITLMMREKETFTFWELNGSSILHLNKFKFPSPKDTLFHVWLKLVQWYRRKRIKSFVNVFSLSRNYLPLKKGVTLHLSKLQSSSTKDALCQVWLKLAWWLWRRRWKCEKFTTTTTTDNGQIVTRNRDEQIVTKKRRTLQD